MVARAWLGLCLTTFGIASVVHSSFRSEDVIVDDCRIKGIALAKMKDGKYHFNYTTAVTVCQQLGLTLAKKDEVEEARRNGFETCSYGWVIDGIGVISRIHPNEKCGQSNTGTVTWSASRAKQFNAYCFNASDTWINSCKPDPTTTSMTTMMITSAFEPTAATVELETVTSENKTTMQTRRDTERTATDAPVTSRGPKNAKTLIPKSATQCSFLLKLITAEVKEDISAPAKSREALKSEQVIFGGLPTALLILALIFLTAAVVLAVCYVRKYKTTLPITSKGNPPEHVEVKVLKETKTNTKSSNEEQNQNGKPAENTQSMPVAAAVSTTALSSATVPIADTSVEAEV